ncbi:hypothetical protein [uncultured Meiothermus sp.]|uniref:hypothetical protein n=1 Tax=uncultured Meiothermus sp. TaxID=157471 RepID=UPI0026106F18|nr:hypothetical protein [uncultured Meiothermus sp.]
MEIQLLISGQTEWLPLENPRNLQTRASVEGHFGFRLECDGLGFRPRDHMGQFFAHFLVLQNYLASTDLKYLPKAAVSYRIFSDKIELEIQAYPADLPALPQGFAGWEGRNPTHMTYNAKPRELQALVDFLKHWVRS